MKLREVLNDAMFVKLNSGGSEAIFHKGQHDDNIRVVVGTGGGWSGLTPMSMSPEEEAKFTPDMEVQVIHVRYPAHCE